ncbi:MAG: ADP-ribosylglycohydrolase family protein [Acidobacteria bacterium]|nr:ADP-ribosylglycohydrolase family protein [Acidobacteriota bacterium]
MQRVARVCVLFAALVALSAAQQNKPLKLSLSDYQDRVQAAWTGQIVATLMGFQFEHKTASTIWVDRFPKKYEVAPVDDDYYYEIVALRAFEKYGIDLTIEQLGRQWLENAAGSWGSSEQARLLLERGVKPPDTGHPRYNKLWFTIGQQFSADIYGLLAPGNPNLAGRLARKYGHINGYAEAVDGAVFIAGMVSLGFRESDPRTVVREAARLIDPSSPYRQCLDGITAMAGQGKTAEEIFQAVEERWHIEYPATNNAVANGGIVATSVWFGEGDFLKTVNLAYRAADFTDADCNAANAAAVVGAMRGMKALPPHLVEPLRNRIVGSEMGGVKLTPPVDESIPDLARRTVAVGRKLLAANGGSAGQAGITTPYRGVETQPAERFRLADLMEYWNPAWKLERAGFGGAGGGMQGIRGITYLDGDVLATYPRDEVRGVVLRRRVKLGANPSLRLEVAADEGRAWQLEIYVNNTNVLSRVIEGRRWEALSPDLGPFRGQEVEIRLYQRVLAPKKIAGNAYWRNLRVE